MTDSARRAEQWIEKRRQQGDTLAETFYQLLKDAAPQVRAHFYGQIEASMAAVEALKKSRGESRGTER